MKANKTIVLAAISILGLSSCSDDGYKPGPDDNPDCMTVYFEPLKSYNITIGPDDSSLLPITVGRALYDDEASVPLVVRENIQNAVVPQTIEFAAGEQTKTIFIDLENMESKTSGKIDISIASEYSSPYGAGSADLALSVTKAGQWLLLAEDGVVEFTETFPRITQSIYMLDGTETFKFPDFLGSGLDLQFTLSDPNAYWPEIIPITNFIDYKVVWPIDPVMTGWYLYNTTDDLWTTPWSLGGYMPQVAFFLVETDGGWQPVINFAEGKAYFYPKFEFEDGNSRWIDFEITFTSRFNPFQMEE